MEDKREFIGRERELSLLREVEKNNRPEFVAIYGRRRVGKTFLVRNAFKGIFTFQMTGVANVSTKKQLINFWAAFNQYSDVILESPPDNWMEAFVRLRKLIEQKNADSKIVFIDELPWFDTPRSGFISALEHFWNSFGSAQSDLKLIVCGSAASWIINKLINNHGGLHNRVTRRIHLQPFTLHEVENYFQTKNVTLDRYQIVQLYSVMGGIPFYLNTVEKGKSAFQIIDRLCFSEIGFLRTEYQNLYRSLFQNAESHLSVVEVLSRKAMGLTREEIIQASELTNGGSATKVLNELEVSGFIKRYQPFNRKQRNSLYQLTDPYSLFYNKFIKDSRATGEGTWLNLIDSPAYRAWSGYAFEYVCMHHVQNIKKALGISGVYTEISSWRSTDSEGGAQIDLLIDRKDKVITVCEMKFSSGPFEITKAYAANLGNKLNVFKTESKTRKSVFLAMVTTFGLKPNVHSLGLVQNEVTMDALFAD